MNDYQEERQGLIDKILKLKEEIRRLRKDNYDYWTDADWVEYDTDYAIETISKHIEEYH
jgi:hypothetical protein